MAKANHFRFSTKYQEDETDLFYYGHRYYTATTGRWLSKDPTGEVGGQNLYGFVRNNPIWRYDRLGLWSCCADKCQVIGETRDFRVEVSVVPSGRLPEDKGFVEEAGGDLGNIAELGELLSTVLTEGAGKTFVQAAAGRLNLPQELAMSLYQAMIAFGQGNFDGVNIYTRVKKYKRCEKESCLIFKTRKNWISHGPTEWKKCTIGDLSFPGNPYSSGLYGDWKQALGNCQACIDANIQEVQQDSTSGVE
jgi:RHS repeat-associated protein